MKKAMQRLLEAAKEGRLSHAYLFSGNDEGTIDAGLEMFLHSLVSYEVVRIRGVESETQNGRYEIKVGQIRELIATFSLSAWSDKGRVAVIEKAHTMNQEAQSAFLKLLEEPRENNMFILLSDRADSLMGTIKSRVQEVKFFSFAPSSAAIAMNDLKSLGKSTIRERFERAKEMAEQQDLQKKLQEWQGGARELLKNNLGNETELKKYRKFIDVLMDTSFAIQQTNVSRKLALETLLLSI